MPSVLPFAYGWYYVFKLTDGCQKVEHYKRPVNISGVAMALDHMGARKSPASPVRRPDAGWLWQGLIAEADHGPYAYLQELGVMHG